MMVYVVANDSQYRISIGEGYDRGQIQKADERGRPEHSAGSV
jgi:hypothetical protein